MAELSRRDLLAGAAALSATSMLPSVTSAASKKAKSAVGEPILPRRLREGDKIAIVAPASLADPASDLEEAVANVRALGFKPVLSPNAGAKWGYLAGTDEQRAHDFNWAIADDSIAGILFLQGGYGTTRMIHLLDYKLFKQKPKVVCGYSDITGICNALTSQTGVVTFHGPIALAKFDGFEGEWFRKTVMSAAPVGELGYPKNPTTRQPAPGPSTIQGGKAKGRLVGGNLTLVSSLAGTPYLPSFKDAILFLEDINEAPYRVDRMLTQLWSSGNLGKLKGIVFGDFREKAPEPNAKPFDPSIEFTMAQVLENVRLWVKCPIFTGGNFGHLHDKWTLPIGGIVEIDADRRTISLNEPVVRE